MNDRTAQWKDQWLEKQTEKANEDQTSLIILTLHNSSTSEISINKANNLLYSIQ